MKFPRSNTFFRLAILAVLAFMCLPALALFANSGGSLLIPAFMGLTLLDLARAGESDMARDVIELNVGAYPELVYFPAESLGAGKLSYKTLKRIAYPSASFHLQGGGVASSSSITKLETFETFPISSRIEVARQTAIEYPRGGVAGLLAFESNGVAGAVMYAISKQIWYGRGGASNKGFPGLKNFTAFGTTATDPISGKVYNMCIDATGTTSNGGSSVYLVRFSKDPVKNPDACQLEFGNVSPFELPQFRVGDMVDPSNSALKVEALISVMTARVGLQTASEHCVRRITNLTDQTGKKLTDTLLAQALAEFPQNMRPDAIFMSAHQRLNLQTSRSVVLQGSGTSRPDQPTLAPIPTEYDGIPIRVTDALLDTDAIEVAVAAEE